MSVQSPGPQDSSSADEVKVRALYRELLNSWNKRSAEDFAALFIEDGENIGFDGSQLIGQTEITSTLQQIFADHVTAPYVGKVRDVLFLGPDVAVLRAIAGMVPPGQVDLERKLNAVQTLVVAKYDGTWRIVLFQNTPAQLHGRPDLVEQMTEELRQLLE